MPDASAAQDPAGTGAPAGFAEEDWDRFLGFRRGADGRRYLGSPSAASRSGLPWRDPPPSVPASQLVPAVAYAPPPRELLERLLTCLRAWEPGRRPAVGELGRLARAEMGATSGAPEIIHRATGAYGVALRTSGGSAIWPQLP